MGVVKGEDLLIEGNSFTWIVEHIVDACNTCDKVRFEVMFG